MSIVYTYPPQSLTVSPTPVQYLKNGVQTAVSIDTVTPANSNPLPITAQSFPLPTGAATEAKQDTGNTSLSSIDGKFTTLNAKDFATSAKQDTGNSSLSSIDGKFTTLNAKDFATSAKQDTGNSSLSSIDGKLQDNGFLDAGNSSVAPLAIAGVFTGVAFEVTKYAVINVNVMSDVASATNGVKVEFSTDGTNWDHSHQTTYTAATGVGYIFNAEYRYARVVYTNGAAAQTFFRLQTIFKTGYVAPSLYTLDQTVTGGMFAQLQKSTIIGKTTGGGGGFVDVKVNPSGALTVEATVSGVSTLAEQQTQTTAIGSLTETAPATDTASSGLNGRLQRIAQRLTSLIALFPTSIGQKIMSNSLSVTIASDHSDIRVVNQSTGGPISVAQLTVGATAVRATVSGFAPASNRKTFLVKPSKNNTGSIYIGDSTVTTSTGLEIIGPDRLEFPFDTSDYYLISDTAGQVVEILEVT